MTAKIIPINAEKASPWEDVKDIPYLKRNRASGVYFVRKFKAGKGELFRTTGERTKAAARTVADQMISAWLMGEKAPTWRRSVKLVVHELDQYLELQFQAGERRLATRKHDKDYLPLISELFGDEFIDEIDEEFWEKWTRFDGRRLDRTTFFDIAKYLSKTLTYAYERKLISRKPKIKNPDKPKKTGRVFSDEEIASLMEAADPRTLSQIVLGYQCGLRSYEVRCLEKKWIRFERPDQAILDLPESFVKANARTIQLSREASLLLMDQIGLDYTDSPFVYPSPTRPLEAPESAVYQNRRWRRLAEKAGITGRTWFRYLRQSFYNKVLLELGLPVQQVSAYGGTSIQTLQKHYLLPDPKRTAAVGQAIQIPTATRGKFVGFKREKEVNDGKE